METSRTRIQQVRLQAPQGIQLFVMYAWSDEGQRHTDADCMPQWCSFKWPGRQEDAGPEAAGASETQGLPEEGMTKLYGQWQTRPWAAPVAAGGLVPKNERGNVHAPPFAAALPVVGQHTNTFRVLQIT